jgi:hypothetical protein
LTLRIQLPRILSDVWYQLLKLGTRSSQAKLAQNKKAQGKLFHDLQDNFTSTYQKLKKFDISQFTTPLWENYNRELEKVFLPHPSFSFLKDPVIMKTMFVIAGRRWLKTELTLLEERIPRNKLRFLLQEDYVGDPLLLNPTYLTSHNSIHHLYHLIRFLDKTRCNLDQVDTIVEWGGGYGNMAKILKRLKSAPFTYAIIDTPLLSCVQWLYLATIFGERNVHILQNTENTIHIHKINLVPICFVNQHKINADLFISTWALSESSKYSQDYVVANDWFHSRHILLSYQDSDEKLPYAGRVGKLARSIGAVIEDIEFLPGNHYAFL